MPRTLKKKLRAPEKERLARLRERLSLTQREMAKLLNVSNGAVAHWEQGNRTIPGAVIKLMEIYEKEKR